MDRCRHKKKSPYYRQCYECGAKRAGPKPEPTFKVGWYAIADNMECPGRVVGVHVELMGLAVENQSWSEEVVITNGYETWRGPASQATRLVAEKL